VAKFHAAATDECIRGRGASGGFVTAFLSFLLEDGTIDAAIVAGDDPREPWRSVARVVGEPSDLVNSAGSRYTLVPTNTALSDAPPRSALVGLPCHVLAFRKLEQIDPDLAARIVLVIGLFCGVNLDPRATEHMLSELGVADRSQIASYHSRSADYGGARVVLRDGSTLRYADHDSYGFDVVRLAPLFQRTRCALCFDNVNELADVSVGDAKGKPHNESCIIVRTNEALGLVRSAAAAGRLSLSDMPPDMHLENVVKKRRRAFAVLEWMRDRGLPTIEHDVPWDPRDYSWRSERDKEEMLLLRELARSEIGRRMFTGLCRNELAYDLGMTYVGWKG